MVKTERYHPLGKRTDWEDICLKHRNDFIEDPHSCYSLYWPEEICVKISKDKDSWKIIGDDK